MSSFHWSRFTVRINIKSNSIEQLYRAWATKAGIEFWFLRMSEYSDQNGNLRSDDEPVQKGDTYRWRWFGYSDEVTETGEILECNGTDFFKFRFGPAGVCSVTIKEEQGETFVELVQEQIPTDEKGQDYYHVGCKTGWTFHFTNMKSIFEGGIDLRNKREDITGVINS